MHNLYMPLKYKRNDYKNLMILIALVTLDYLARQSIVITSW